MANDDAKYFHLSVDQLPAPVGPALSINSHHL